MSRPGPVLGLERPTRTRTATASPTVAERMAGGDHVQVKFDAPPHIHTALKLRCVERRTTLRAYLLELLANDGIR